MPTSPISTYLDQSLLLENLAGTRGGKVLFSELTQLIKPGQLLHIVGKNGSGKSSLLRILCGLLSPSSGQVKWSGQAIRTDAEQFNAQLIYLGHVPALKGDLTAAENLLSAALCRQDALSISEVDDVLRKVGLLALRNTMVRTLSQGQKQRIALAQLQLQPRKQFWLLDEPFNALDRDASDALQQCIQQHLQLGGIVALSSHQEILLQQPNALVRIEL
ncbi:cytochrome c biogenesis heme-transporting ATPase CcmA [Polynucleobacter sp. IMCC 30228]|uniref:cytochrome c biogenesis heme-transporting ATPase CcmA n=1 Tax=Polynucleobacter sp. IMCC 30228 TaxID=2781011 RepID=UPI001F353AFE|nr:cytochrome c biogenesis heme-transporting ATPase CcmA [Polynucleobacter sp. IMCC 30228]MCE7527586.1 cytochrome c biogenesis heme-transporting ATPase CcmA [Polynucleobacter sp. IMCC 30228]